MDQSDGLINSDESNSLTANQLHVWTAQKLLFGQPIYNLPVALHIFGIVDPQRFQRAFQALVNSADALRMVFEESDGVPSHRVMPRLDYEMPFVDFSDRRAASDAARQWMQDRSVLSFDLGGRLFDATLTKVSEEHFIFFLVIHHLISDAWSIQLIYHHLAQLYDVSFPEYAPEQIPLASYANFPRSERGEKNLARQKKAQTYWEQKLSAEPEATRFFGVANSKTGIRVTRRICDLGVERSKKLLQVICDVGAGKPSKGTLLLHAFYAVTCAYLARIHNNRNGAIGLVSHNRRSKLSKQVIGLVSEVLPVRVPVCADDSFCSLLKRVQAETFDALRNGNFAVANPIHKQVYDVVLNCHRATFNNFAGIPAMPEWIHTGYGFESLVLQIYDFSSTGSLVVSFDFHEDVFSNQQQQLAADHFVALLDAVLADPGKAIDDLELVSAGDRRSLFPISSDQDAAGFSDVTVHKLFEQQVQKAPDATALQFDEDIVTYADLNGRANRLARYLKRFGVGAEFPVGICLERSIDLIVGYLAILKAGGGFVPIDPATPRDRIKKLLDDTALPLLITRRTLLEHIPCDEMKVICLDSDEQQIGAEHDDDLGTCSESGQLAYIIHTSGSTSEPKGVEICHRSLANFCHWATRFYHLTASERILQFAAISFDAAVEEIFPCLIAGATLVLRTASSIVSVPVFLDQCRQWMISILDLPTSYWHELTTALYLKTASLPDSVKLVIIGGEGVSPARLAEWHYVIGNRCRLVNTYGPTEATVVTTAGDLVEVEETGGANKPVSIGRPIFGAQTYVLDRRMRPVPIGVAGELYIGGVGLARGYRNHPELTAAAFIPNPFSFGSMDRLYRTGDLVRWRADGEIEFLGRVDRQVKIHGYRVEPGEVENALSGYPGVREAFVCDSDMACGEKRIVAYVIPEPAATLAASELLAYLARKLPAYMLPASIQFIERLPRSGNGKVDRNSLPKPSATLPLCDEVSVTPRSPVEKALADIWREILGLDQVKIHESFFQLGGHSLNATQVISRIRDRFQIELPLRALFDSPTIAGLANQIQLALQYTGCVVERPPLTPADRSRDLPLSYSQSRMWFMHKLAPQSPAYNLGAALRLRGALNRQALSDSINEIVRRHEALRTTFPSVDGQPRQVVTEWKPVTIRQIDLRALPAEAAVEKARHQVAEEARRPFDLERQILVRSLLVQLAEDDHVLAVSMHHIVSDQWSMGIIAREITHLYSHFCNGSLTRLGGLALQYADFAVWQRQWLKSDVLQRQLSDWKAKLGGLNPLHLPSDRPRPSQQTFNGAHVTCNLSHTLVSGLKRLSADQGATLYMTFLAAIKALLYRYSGETDITLGSPIANRNWLALENIVGTFVNTLVLRTDLSGNPKFCELLERVREVTLDAFARQVTPFEKLVEELQPQRDPSFSPLVQVLFNFQNAPLGNLNLRGLSWEPFEFELGASQFDLCLAVDPNVLNKIILQYNSDIFDQWRMQRMLEHYVRILEAMVANPQSTIANVNILSESEKKCIGRISTGDQSDATTMACAHELFEAQAARTPQALAVNCEGETLSYHELNRRANQLAHYLKSLGVGLELPVAIYMEKSAAMIVSLLGILKAGAAYVPLDAAYPAKRIALMLKDSAAPIVLTQQRLLNQLPPGHSRVVCVDSEWTTIERQSATNPISQITAENLAYLIYTSGSTGRPKGVEVPHRALVNFLISMAKEPGIDFNDVLLSVTPLSFDISALEIFLPLTVGAQVVLLSRDVTVDGRLLRECLDRSGATMMQATPMTWRMLIAAGWKGNANLKILCGGEALSRELADALLARGASVYNLYGPTETTIWSTVWRVEPGSGAIVIGHPIDNTQLYILDENLQQLPIGIEGDLYVGGLGVAQGYRGNPSLTQEKFVADPFSRTITRRLFKTGDRARYLVDGNIEYLGRSDYQVKLRGHRIELGDVESILAEHPSVDQSVVVARADGAGEKQLVSYVVPVNGLRITQADLRRYARETLPSYMVPASFVLLDALPLTPNGKVDRNALPAPISQKNEMDRKVLPRDRLELELVKIWQELLEAESVGLTDNFFNLGGHSLLALRLVAQIENLTGRNVPVATLFRAPTIEQLSALVRDDSWSEKWSNLLPIQTRGSRTPFFMIHGETANLFLADYLGTDRPIFALQHQSEDGQRALYTEVEKIAAHYREEICTVQPQGPYLLCGYSFGGVIAFEIAQQLKRDHQEVGMLALIDTLSLGQRNSQFDLLSSWDSMRASYLSPFTKAREWLAKYASLSRREVVRTALDEVPRLIKNFASDRIGKFSGWLKRTVGRIYANMGYAIPAKLRSAYILDIYRKAAQAYSPCIYPGRVIYFKSHMNCSDPRLSWGNLVKGEFTMYEIPGTHMDLREGPFVEAWASIIKHELDKFSANQSVVEPVVNPPAWPSQRARYEPTHA